MISTNRAGQPRPTTRCACTAIGAALILAVLIGLVPTSSVAQVPDARLFASHALALRAAGVAGEQEAVDFLTTLPGSGMVAAETLSALWSPFFANAVVKLGRLRSPGPVALYYDPLLDIAVITQWQRQGNGYRVVSGHGLPGSRLVDPEAEAKLQPRWMTLGEHPVTALVQVASQRLMVFRQAHPPESQNAGRANTTFACGCGGYAGHAAKACLECGVAPRVVGGKPTLGYWTR